MAYQGRNVDTISNVEKLDAITFDGSSSYTLQKGGVNFVPSGPNNLLVSIDGVVNAGNFTVSGSTIDFGVAVAGTSTNNFIFHYGTGLITTPGDGTVSTAKLATDAVTEAKIADNAVESEHLNDNIISGQTELATTPADTDEFLISDAGTIKRIDYSHIKGSSDFVKLASAEITSAVANVDIEGYFSSTYENYRLILNSVHPASDASIRVQYKFGSSYATSNYYWNWDGSRALNNSSSTDNNNAYFGNDSIYVGDTSHTNQDWSGHVVIDIYQAYKTDRHKYVQSWFIGGNAQANTPLNVIQVGGIQYTDLSAMSGIRVLMSTGNIESMDWTLYGMKN